MIVCETKVVSFMNVFVCRVGGVLGAVCQSMSLLYDEYVDELYLSFSNRKLEMIVCTSAMINIVPKDCPETPSKALHYELDDQFRPITLKFCSRDFYLRWLHEGQSISLLSLALGAWPEDTESESSDDNVVQSVE